MKKNLFIAAMGLLVLAGCSNNEEIDNLVAKADNAIKFDSYVGKTTKAAVDGTTLPVGDHFGVFAYNDTWADATSTPNFMYNQDVDANGVYAPIKYWPDGGVITFLSYYPLDADGLSFKTAEETPANYANTSTGLPIANFTVQTTATAQVDFMYDLQKNVVFKNPMNIPFKHALSKVTFKAKMDAALKPGTTVTITEIKLSNINNTGNFKFADAEWDAVTGKEGFTLTVGSLKFTDESTTTAQTINDVFLMIPQALQSEGDIQKATIAYTVETIDDNVAGKKVTFTKNIDVTLHNSKAESWVQNNVYTYTLSIALNEVTLTTSVEKWAEGTDVP